MTSYQTDSQVLARLVEDFQRKQVDGFPRDFDSTKCILKMLAFSLRDNTTSEMARMLDKYGSYMQKRGA